MEADAVFASFQLFEDWLMGHGRYSFWSSFHRSSAAVTGANLVR